MFFIVGLPRSRTAWLSVYFTAQGFFCYHDGLNGCKDIQSYRKKMLGACGDADSGLLLIDVEKEFPDSKIVVIERSLKEVMQSLEDKFNIHAPHLYKFHHKLFEYQNALHVKFEDIDKRIEEIFEFCVGQKPDKDIHDLISNMHIEINKFEYDPDTLTEEQK
jgi:hypothetical protein